MFDFDSHAAKLSIEFSHEGCSSMSVYTRRKCLKLLLMTKNAASQSQETQFVVIVHHITWNTCNLSSLMLYDWYPIFYLYGFIVLCMKWTFGQSDIRACPEVTRTQPFIRHLSPHMCNQQRYIETKRKCMLFSIHKSGNNNSKYPLYRY